jgi:hypothetical protein
MNSAMKSALATPGFVAAGTVNAGTMVGLAADNNLVIIDQERSTVERQMTVQGVEGKLIGIDVRPSNGKLYGVASDNGIYTIDATSGKATLATKMNKPFPMAERAIVDFNPVADRLRLMSSEGTSFRVNVDTGEVAVDGSHNYDKATAWAGTKPWIGAGAYTNSFAGTRATELINVDLAQGMLMLQAPPNDGVLKGVAKLSIRPDAFDVSTDSNGGNTGWAVAGTELYLVDLKNGASIPAGEIKGLRWRLTDFAAMPK